MPACTVSEARLRTRWHPSPALADCCLPPAPCARGDCRRPGQWVVRCAAGTAAAWSTPSPARRASNGGAVAPAMARATVYPAVAEGAVLVVRSTAAAAATEAEAGATVAGSCTMAHAPATTFVRTIPTSIALRWYATIGIRSCTSRACVRIEFSDPYCADGRRMEFLSTVARGGGRRRSVVVVSSRE